MRVLLTGASGFMGRAVAQALHERGHAVVRVLRHPPAGAQDVVQADFAGIPRRGWWVAQLAGIDAVVNAVGILREQRGQRFDDLHVRGPAALFEACVQAGVPRVLQVSALGADERATSAYHLSKRAADDHLLSLPLSATVVQPSLVYGAGGASAALFTAWASLPVVPLPHDGRQSVQPLHVDDLVQALQALLESGQGEGLRLPLVGPRPVSLRGLLAALRQGMGLPPARWLEVPPAWVRAAVAVGSRWPGALADRDTLAMLERGNTAPADATVRLLGREPRPVESFIEPERAGTERLRARLAWALPPLRVALGLVWVVTALLSFGLYPVQDSYALLARLGITGPAAPVALYGAAALDLVLGAATLAGRGRPWIWWGQIALMLGYMVLITWALPEFWRHPFGPILKNLPMLAAVSLLLALEEPRWTT